MQLIMTFWVEIDNKTQVIFGLQILNQVIFGLQILNETAIIIV